MTINPENIDVNIKADKSETIFKEENKVIYTFTIQLENSLSNEITSKNYYVGVR